MGGSRFRVGRLIVGGGLLTVIAGGTVGAQTGEATVPTHAEHAPTVYTLVPDSSDNIRSAIDHTVEHMNFITRPIARSRLGKVNPTPHEMRVDRTADSVSIAFDNGNPVVTPLDGNTVPWSNPLTHETDHARATVVGDTVKQTISASDGDRENALVFLNDSARVRLRVTVTSHRLPRPLVYDLFFAKSE